MYTVAHTHVLGYLEVEDQVQRHLGVEDGAHDKEVDGADLAGGLDLVEAEEAREEGVGAAHDPFIIGRDVAKEHAGLIKRGKRERVERRGERGKGRMKQMEREGG